MNLIDKYIQVKGVNIHYVTAEPLSENNLETLVFLHGFPEYWGTWRKQLSYFAKQFRVIAPDLPGYNLSDKPKDTTFYQVPNLITFFAEFINAIAPNKKVTLIAHDWGGAIAWPLVAFHPNLFQRLVILNAAHPSTFTREMINNPEQRKKSEYIHQLIASNAEEILSNNNYQYLKDKMSDCDPHAFTNKVQQQYEKVWQQSGAINGMLQYYRAMPQLAASGKGKEANNKSLALSKAEQDTSKMKIPNIRIDVPTFILWGEHDQAFVNENLDDIERFVPNCQIKHFSDASHWLQHDKPKEINQHINEFIHDFTNE